jgi:flagellar motor switch protein FliN/FliY
MVLQGAEAAGATLGGADAIPAWDANRYHSEVKEAMAAIDPSFGASTASPPPGPDLAPRTARVESPANLDTILRIPVSVQVVLGSATMPVASLLKLGRGAVIPLDHRVGEPVDVVVNGRLVARGEVVVVEDDNSRFGVSLTEIIGPTGAEAAA